jgi:hypothetical protein
MMDTEKSDLEEELDLLAKQAACFNDVAIRSLAMALCERIADDIALRAENDALRKMLREPLGVSCRVAGWSNLKTVAAITGFNEETVRLWCVHKKVDSIRQGGAWAVRIRSAIAYAGRQKGGLLN